MIIFFLKLLILFFILRNPIIFTRLKLLVDLFFIQAMVGEVGVVFLMPKRISTKGPNLNVVGESEETNNLKLRIQEINVVRRKV